MGIVRSDKRPEALKLIAEVGTQLSGLLVQADALQATIEALEIELGLSNEGAQSTRDQYLVLHYRKGDEVGHPLAECNEECAGGDSLSEIGEGEEEDPAKDAG